MANNNKQKSVLKMESGFVKKSTNPRGYICTIQEKATIFPSVKKARQFQEKHWIYLKSALIENAENENKPLTEVFKDEIGQSLNV